MSTTTVRTEPAVTLRETDLLEAGIVALESGEYEQCVGHMRDGDTQRCAEGVLAEVLIAAYPEAFSWEGDYLIDGRKCWMSPRRLGGLTASHWWLLHPLGREIAERAARRSGYSGVQGLNDVAEWSFAEIAAALRQAKAEIEAEMLA